MFINLIKKFFDLLPDNDIKKGLRYKYYNISNKFNFKIYPTRKGYKIIISNMTLYFESDPFYELYASIPGYFKEYKLKNGDIVIDAGAHVGIFTIIAAKLVGERGKVFAFEPDKKSGEELQRNVIRNNIKNIKIIKKGLWSENTELKFSDSGDRGILIGSNETINDDNNENKISLRTTTIDDFVKENSIDQVNFIKMDIEGAEIEALKGSINTLNQFDLKLTIASYHEIDGEKTSYEIEKLLQKYGYETKTAYPLHLTTYGWKKSNRNI